MTNMTPAFGADPPKLNPPTLKTFFTSGVACRIASACFTVFIV